MAFDDGTEWRVLPEAFTWSPDGENFVAAGPGFWYAGDEPFPVNAEPARPDST